MRWVTRGVEPARKKREVILKKLSVLSRKKKTITDRSVTTLQKEYVRALEDDDSYHASFVKTMTGVLIMDHLKRNNFAVTSTVNEYGDVLIKFLHKPFSDFEWLVTATCEGIFIQWFDKSTNELKELDHITDALLKHLLSIMKENVI
jgi:hypothetical protein